MGLLGEAGAEARLAGAGFALEQDGVRPPVVISVPDPVQLTASWRSRPTNALLAARTTAPGNGTGDCLRLRRSGVSTGSATAAHVM